MAISKDQKHSIVDEVSKAISNSKLTVLAEYKGTSVKGLQELRQQAKDSNTSVKIIKNRLFIRAVKQNEALKNVQPDLIKGMLLYAFNDEDELASAQTIAKFARTQPTVQIIGAFTNTGEFYEAKDAKALSELPTKEALRAQLVGLFASPLSGFTRVLSGNISGLVRALDARASQIS